MKLQSLVTAATLALVLAACNSQKSAMVLYTSSNNGIVNGVDVQADDETAKSTVGLYLKVQEETPWGVQEGFATCSGTLIAENIVLTAGHCIPGVVAGAVVFATDFTKADQSQIRTITGVALHPSFNPKEKGQGDWSDIALFKFEGSIPAGYKVAPILKDVSKLTKGLPVIFAGFGITSPAGGLSQDPDDSGVLRKADTVLTSATYEGNELLFNLTANGVSTCQGDSGGPAYAKINGELTVIGVTSRGENARCDGVSISTSVAQHVKFIEDSIKDLMSQTPAEPVAPAQQDVAQVQPEDKK
jgi:secreted trypsin-like serine protease